MVKRVSEFSYEVTVVLPKNKPGADELVKNMLIALGINLAGVAEHIDKNGTVFSFYLSSDLKARQFQKEIRALRLTGVEIKKKRLKRRDWQDAWKKDFKPFFLTEEIEVVPVWLKTGHKSRKPKVIYIDTSMAFGTGLHETTRFMARLLESQSGKFTSMLDIGTGTGILAIVARLHGAQTVEGIDNDAKAVRVAKDNLLVNQITKCRVRTKGLEKLRADRKYDFVCANLITDDLILMRRRIMSLVKASGYLAVSGISMKNLPRFQREFQNDKLWCLKILRGRKWAALLYRKVG